MAYVQDDDSEESNSGSNNTGSSSSSNNNSNDGGNTSAQNQQVSGGGNTTVPPTLGASSGGSSGPSSSGAAPVTAKTPSAPQFTNLQDYLNANSGSNFGGQVAGQVQNEVNSANQDQTTADSQFQNQVDQGTTQYNPNLINEATSDAASFVQDPNKVSQFDSQLNAQYQGPQSFSSDTSLYNPASQATNQAYNDSQLFNSSGGQQALLSRLYGTPGYTQGQQNLDSLLMGAPSGQQAIQATQQNANQSANNFQNLQNQLNQYAQQGQQTTQNTANQTNAVVTGAQNSAENAVNQQLQNDQNYITQTQPQIQSDLASGNFSNLTPAQVTALGLTPGQNQQLWGANLGTYYTPFAASNLTAYTVATPQHVALINALGQLLGQQPLYNLAQAGTYSQANLNGSINMSGLNNNAISQNQNAFLNAIQAPGSAEQAPGALGQNGGMGLQGIANDPSTSLYNLIQSDEAAMGQGQGSGYYTGSGSAPLGNLQSSSSYQEAAHNLPILQNYLNSLENQYGANQYLNTGTQTNSPTNYSNPILQNLFNSGNIGSANSSGTIL